MKQTNQQINKSTNQQKIFVIIFFIAGVAFIPYTYNSIYDILASSIRLFDLGLISAAACCFILYYYSIQKSKITIDKPLHNKSDNRRIKLLYVTIILLFTIILIQFFYFNKITLNNFFTSLLWITIPLFCCLYSKEISKYLLIYILLIWITNLTACFILPGEKVGITGNRNWNAALIVVCVIFSIYQTYKWIQYLISTGPVDCVPDSKKYYKIILYLIIIINLCLIAYSIFIFYKCESRGALLSGAIVFLLFLYLQIIKYSNFKKRVINYFLYSFLLLLIIISTLFFYKSASKQLSKSSIVSSLKDDVRIPLWIGTLNLIKDYPVIGTTPSSFESIYASYRPLDYFTKPANTVRSNHPHNILLYICAVFGIPGLILWLILWVYPIIYCFLHYSKLSIIKQLAFYCYVFLFLHGLLDLVLFHWPTIYLAAIFLGLLWQKTFKNTEQKTINQQLSSNNQQPITNNSKLKTHYSRLATHYSRLATKSLLRITAVIIAIYIVYGTYINYRSKFYFEVGNYYTHQKKVFRALFKYQEGLKLKINPKYLYRAGVESITSLNNPELALYFFNLFNYIPEFDYAHKNGFIALSLLKTGNLPETLPFLIKEVVNYPLSAGAWYRLYLMQKQLKMNDAAKFSLKNTYRALNTKNLPKSALPLILENPKYDNHPDQIPEEILKKLKSNKTLLNIKHVDK